MRLGQDSRIDNSQKNPPRRKHYTSADKVDENRVPLHSFAKSDSEKQSRVCYQTQAEENAVHDQNIIHVLMVIG